MAKTSKIIIAEGIKLDSTYKNVLSYSQSDMLSLVTTNQVASADNYSFIRQEKNTVQVGFSYSTICNANYMAFQNKDYNNRWFFAFIKDIQYINDGCVNIVFDIDVWSTFYDSMNIMKCFVEREHVNDDTIGKHTVPENLSTGEPMVRNFNYDTSFNTTMYVGVLTDWLPETSTTPETDKKGKQFSGIAMYNGNLFGHQLVLFEMTVPSSEPQHGYEQADLLSLLRFIAITNHDGHIADVKDMFIIPVGAIDESTLNEVTCYRSTISTTTVFYTVPQKSTPEVHEHTIPKQLSFGVQIKNNKCLCYPYNYLLVSNQNGNQNTYRYENFTDQNNATFSFQTALSIGISGVCVPTNYLNLSYNYDEAIPLGKYPTCSWSADSYTNWLTQQAVNIPTKIVGSAIRTGSQIATGDTIGASIGGAMTIANMIGEFYQAQLQPNIEGGGNVGDVLNSAKQNVLMFKCMQCKDEYISVIDSYFNRFGYKINETKTPNLTGRQYWNYIKIGGADRFATGNIQSKFLDVINNIAQQGTTIWHSHANIGNYDLNNVIV